MHPAGRECPGRSRAPASPRGACPPPRSPRPEIRRHDRARTGGRSQPAGRRTIVWRTGRPACPPGPRRGHRRPRPARGVRTAGRPLLHRGRSRHASPSWAPAYGTCSHRSNRLYLVAMPMTHLQIKELLDENRFHDCEGMGKDKICVRIAAIAELPSRFGQYQVVAFWNNRDGKEHAAFVHGDVTGKEDVPVRLHSECLTGDAIGSLRCDCRVQLESALAAIGKMEGGLLLYLRQEGRGIGFLNKIRAYGLQDLGLDTVEANLALGFRDDERDYSVAAHMLRSLKVRSVRLMTNNPRKIGGLVSLGVTVSGRIPLIIPPNQYNRFYLETKKEKSGHLLEQIDRPVLEGMTAEEAEILQD